MNQNLKQLTLTSIQRDTLIREISQLLYENSKLTQNLNQQQLENQADQEKTLLEILEIFDALESLLNICDQNNPTLKRINKNLLTIQKKILNLLAKKDVSPIKLINNQLTFLG